MNKIPHQLTKNVKLLQKAVIVYDNKVLILKRSEFSKSRPLMWDLPGGNSEWPNTTKNKINLHKEDIVREIFEETGIRVSPDNFVLNNMISFKTFFEVKKQIFTVIVGWRIKILKNFNLNEVKISEEHLDYKWISIDQLDNYNFGGDKGEFIVDMIKNY